MSGFFHQHGRPGPGGLDARAYATRGPDAPADLRSPLTSVFPQYQVLRTGFDLINRPAGLATAAAGDSWWYGLESWTADTGLGVGQEFSLVGAAWQMMPSNVGGTTMFGIAPSGGAGTMLGWGDATGTTAYIVCGVNLPGFTLNSWWSARCYIPGIEVPPGAPAAPAPYNWNQLPEYLLEAKFPPGAISDVPPQEKNLRWGFSPFQKRVPSGSSLQVALVMRSTYIAAAPAQQRWVGGWGQVSLLAGLTQSTDQFVDTLR